MECLGADEVDEEQDGGGEQRRRRRRHEGGEGKAQVGRVLGAVPQQQKLRDQTQNLREEEQSSEWTNQSPDSNRELANRPFL